jgi:hypothetical protein
MGGVGALVTGSRRPAGMTGEFIGENLSLALSLRHGSRNPDHREVSVEVEKESTNKF